MPPWEVLGVPWQARARRAWYFAAARVVLDDRQALAKQREQAEHQARVQQYVRQGGARPALPRAPTMRRR